MKKSKKVRVDFRKNRTNRTRDTDWTRKYEENKIETEDNVNVERISGKGEVTRRRTVVGKVLNAEEAEKHGFEILPEVDAEAVLPGRVLRVHGASSVVLAEDGRIFHCVTRRILKTLSTDQRQPIVTGDRVLFRPVGTAEVKSAKSKNSDRNEGMIERVEPRRGSVSRESKNRKHVIVTNVDQILVITSADQPTFKPNLIDRMLLTAEQSGIRPIICINKIDLLDPLQTADLQPLVGVYARMGYQVLQLSTKTGLGLDRFKRLLQDRESVVAGQSGVGKSSLLNAVDPSLKLKTGDIGFWQKGKHTTTTSELLQLAFGGYVVDTPGIRQFMLWDIIPEEVFGFFRDLRPYENRCRFPDCTHSHEDDCAVKNAVGEGRLDLRRYESYLAIRFG